jgi:hypothetical protein
MARRGLLVSVACALLLSFSKPTSGEDKPRPRFELKGKPSVWESTWQHCEGGATEGATGGGGANASFSVVDVVPSPGSFSGRTGHSGSTKFTVETHGKRVEEASSTALHRITRKLCSAPKARPHALLLKPTPESLWMVILNPRPHRPYTSSLKP